MATSSSDRVETIYKPRKRKKNVGYKKNDFISNDESLDDLILENVLKQILNSSHHRKRQQSRPHLQRPQVNRHVMNKVRIPPQFPHYELNKLKSPNAILNSPPFYQNEYGFQVKSHSSKIGYGNGIDFKKPIRHNFKNKKKVQSPIPSLNPDSYNNNSEEDFSDDSILNYVTKKLIEIGIREVNDEAFVENGNDKKFEHTESNSITEDIPSIATPDLSKINKLIEKYNIRNTLAKVTKQPNLSSKYDLKFVPGSNYAVGNNKNKVNQHLDNIDRVQYHEPTLPVYLDSNDQKEIPKPESSLLNRITTEGLKFAINKINNLVFDGKKHEDNLAETISTAIIHDIPNLLLPTFPKIPNIFQNTFGSLKNADESNKTNDLKTSASNIVPTELESTDADNNFRYVFLLGVVPAIVGSFLAVGAQPIQAMLVGAYVVTTYLFFVEKAWRSKRSQKKLARGDYSNEIKDIESIFSNAINKFLKLTKSHKFLENHTRDQTNKYKNVKKTDLNDLLIHKYFDYSDQLMPLLNLMDDQTIMYLKTFDDIMSDLVTSLK